MIEIGKTQTLFVNRAVEFGFYLDGEDLGEVLLLDKHAPDNLSQGDSLEVFLYHNSDGEVVATTQISKAHVGELAFLKVVDITKIGAFLDLGLDKDILVPTIEQQIVMKIGHSYLVYIFIDTINGRIKASSRIERFLTDDKPHNFKPDEPVHLIIAKMTSLGYKAIINHTHWGVLYKNEVHQILTPGQNIKGYIKNIRPDLKIDLTLQIAGQPARDQNESIIKTYLQEHDGFAPIHDKSTPQLIKEVFSMSKSSFKSAIGCLYKQKIIKITKDGISLILENQR